MLDPKDMAVHYQTTEIHMLGVVRSLLSSARSAAQRGEHEKSGALVDQAVRLYAAACDTSNLYAEPKAQ